MALFSLLIPPALFAISSGIFLWLVQLPHGSRQLLFPLVLATGVASLHASPRLAPITGANNLWGLLCCIWILHATSVLLLDKLSIPRGAPPWTSAYKIWNDLRRQIQWELGIPPPPSTGASSRSWFLIRRLSKTLMCWLFQLLILGPLVPGFFNFAASDFHPSKEILIRRLLFSNSGPPISSREVHIRLFVSVYWIWIAYLMLDLCHVLLSILFVVILRLDAPEEWPSLFGSPLQAYSVRRFWARFWHRLTVPCCASTGRQITRSWLRIQPNSRAEKTFLAFWTFFLSGLCHAVADWQAGEFCRPTDDLFFFMVNFAAAALETFALPKIRKLLRRSQGHLLSRVLLSETGTRTIGFMWLLGVFFWSAPKWQYAKLYSALESAEDISAWEV